MVRRIAQTCVGASALRNQGSSGIIETCRNYFESTWGNDLSDFFNSVANENDYKNFLDNHTDILVDMFPIPTDGGVKSWGGARKALNLFFMSIVKDRYICSNYIFDEDDLKNLEIPLDKDVSVGISNHFKTITKWTGIRHLNKAVSDEYQKNASILAKEKNVHRFQLDDEFWRAKK